MMIITFFFPPLGVGLECPLYSYDMYDTSLPLLLLVLTSTLLLLLLLLDFLFFCALLAFSLSPQRGAGMCLRGRGSGHVQSGPTYPPLFPLSFYRRRFLETANYNLLDHCRPSVPPVNVEGERGGKST